MGGWPGQSDVVYCTWPVTCSVVWSRPGNAGIFVAEPSSHSVFHSKNYGFLLSAEKFSISQTPTEDFSHALPRHNFILFLFFVFFSCQNFASMKRWQAAILKMKQLVFYVDVFINNVGSCSESWSKDDGRMGCGGCLLCKRSWNVKQKA